MRLREKAIAFVFVFATMLLLLIKLILSITERANLSAERKFLSFQNKDHFRFFREKYHVKTVFPR